MATLASVLMLNSRSFCVRVNSLSLHIKARKDVYNRGSDGEQIVIGVFIVREILPFLMRCTENNFVYFAYFLG